MKSGNNKEGKKNVPMRTCIATREKRPKNELMRIVQDPVTGKVVMDIKSKIRARGANLVPTIEAFDLMKKIKALPRALKLEKDLTEEEYKVLREDFVKAVEIKTFRPNNKRVTIRVKKEDLLNSKS